MDSTYLSVSLAEQVEPVASIPEMESAKLTLQGYSPKEK
jgi:hypothetical protein